MTTGAVTTTMGALTTTIGALTDERVAEAQVVSPGGESLWFLGTLARIKLTGEQTAGRLGLWDGVLPHGAAPPLHTHPQDETLCILEGDVTAWLVEPALALSAAERGDPSMWCSTQPRRCGAGSIVFAPGGFPHTFRVESDTARMLVLSTPAGIEDLILGLGEPALWPWLQPPPTGPRVPAKRLEAVMRETGMVVHGPPPPPPEG